MLLPKFIHFLLLLVVCFFCRAPFHKDHQVQAAAIPTSSIPQKTTASSTRKPTKLSGYASHKHKEPLVLANNKNTNTSRHPLLWIQKHNDDGWNVRCNNNNTTIRISFDQIEFTNETSSNTSDWIPIKGLYGVYSLPSGQLWVWVVDSRPVYQLENWWDIHKVTELFLCHVVSSKQKQHRWQRQEEQRQVALLRQALKHHDWYYCSDNNRGSSLIIPDLTHNLQYCFEFRQQQQQNSMNATTSQQQQECWWNYSDTNTTMHPDSRFFWNQAALEPLLHNHTWPATQVLLSKALVLTSCFCGVQRQLHINNDNNTTYDQVLLTRRSRFRAGTRFTKRGADHTGNVANYAETEQILVLYNNNNNNNNNNNTLSSPTNVTTRLICSHVQTRGSIPLRWSSPTDIKTYRPRVRIGTDPLAQARALRQHLVDQASRYVIWNNNNNTSRRQPSLVLVNLIDKKSDQGRLGRVFDAVLQAVLDVYEQEQVAEWPWLTSSHIQHVWFDFHAELKHGRWDKLTNLLDQIKPALLDQGYFQAKPKENGFDIERLQTGVIRTNCMDCLDRTNVVQSIIGRFQLFSQLGDRRSTAKLPLSYKMAFRRNPLSLPWNEGEMAHRHLWADNADAISRLYAGTPALKGDFTRTGKRTKKGALDDGMNSLQRYYLNNFLDADRQEGMDLLVGHQAFRYVHGDEDEFEKMEAASLAIPAKLRHRSMTVQEAARQMLLGIQEDDQEEAFHVRIKQKKRSRNRLRQLPSGGAIGRQRRSLDLLWLPGDLQSHFRSRASSSLLDLPGEFPSRAALEAIDRRAASDLPWWVVADSASDSEEKKSMDSVVSEVEAAAINNAGYLLGALVCGSQAPLAMATVVMGLIGLVSLPANEER